MQVCLLNPGLPTDDAGDAVGRLVTGLAAREGVDVTLALTEHRPTGDRDARLGAARVVAVERALGERFDVAVAMDWTATARLFEVPAERHAFWVDELAHHRLGAWQVERIAAALAYDLPVDFVAAGEGVAAQLRELRPDARVLLARTGVDAEVFAPADAAAGTGGAARPLRVAVVAVPDGDPAAGWADAALAQVDGTLEVTRVAAGAGAAERAAALGRADVALWLSTVGGTFGAPLQAMAAGATVVVMPVAEEDGLVRHGENGVVAEPDDVRGVARWLDHLDRDRDWLAQLRTGARATAAAWPTWDEAAAELAAALQTIAGEPAPEAARWPVRLMADAMAAVAVYRNDHFVLRAELDRLHNDEAVKAAALVRDKLRSPRLASVRRVAAPAVRAARRRLG